MLDIKDGIDRIEKYTRAGRPEFEKSEIIQTWCSITCRLFAKRRERLPRVARCNNPRIPWEKIAGMRNILIHQYFGIDTEIIWAVVEKDLQGLKLAIEEMLQHKRPPGE